jgi:hypothetical protein
MSAIITAGGTVVGLFGTVFGAFLAYRSATAGERIKETQRKKEKDLLLTNLLADVRNRIKFVDGVLVRYRKFDEPVTLRVLSMPQTAEVLAQAPERLAQLGTPMTEAIATVRQTLDDYRRAKGPTENSWRNNLRLSKDDREVQLRAEVQLRTRPDGFDEVIVQAEAYRAALNHLEQLASEIITTGR